MASQARKQLSVPIADIYARFIIYMWPYGFVERMQLLGQAIVLIFHFGGEPETFDCDLICPIGVCKAEGCKLTERA